jgi:hypothetical protein
MVMNKLWSIGLLLFLVAIVGCASELQPREPAQSVREKTQEQESQKPAMPTFTYRPGA